MADKKNILYRFAKLLNLANDYISTGYMKPVGEELTFEKFYNKNNDKKAPGEEKPEEQLDVLVNTIKTCTKCRLHMGRKKPVPGEGVVKPKLMIIGEAPGEEEDISGKPFVGPAGQYLTKWIEAIKLDRQKDCYIANIVKCRPLQNRQPSEDESEACFPYLREQIEIIRPKTILCVGLVSSKMLTRRANATMSALRERTYEYMGIPLCVTYHPSAVLRDTSFRKPVWEDLQKLLSILEKNISC